MSGNNGGVGLLEKRECWYDDESSNEKRCRIIAMAVITSALARFCPMQTRGPLENGKNMLEPLPFVAFTIPCANLSGLNSITSSPHISRS
ncbi:hypothetical protein L1987_54688 [Smallanthus sonchifolius]|uniref:Uncharacterized protein n=1 Tax=Smallanthus sonchifolius TaxID=185202 RepID=A0ACB9E861_9ASTR|nr:hypothetical protein L1987_54688 [Smallanthus sonchifolius]